MRLEYSYYPGVLLLLSLSPLMDGHQALFVVSAEHSRTTERLSGGFVPYEKGHTTEDRKPGRRGLGSHLQAIPSCSPFPPVSARTVLVALHPYFLPGLTVSLVRRGREATLEVVNRPITDECIPRSERSNAPLFVDTAETSSSLPSFAVLRAASVL